MIKKKKITIVGSGYVGMSLSVLLAQHNNVIVLDVDKERVEKINANQSTVDDADIDNFLDQNKLSIKATIDKDVAYDGANFIIIATPTNFDVITKNFDTSIVDNVVKDALGLNKKAFVVIKSTIPIGHTEMLQKKFLSKNIIFSPEFLREGKALNDNLYPSRIVIGSNSNKAIEFANLLKDAAKKTEIKTCFMTSSEAEATKLFANTYLAMRVAFFNELDTYSIINKFNTKNIIEALSYDERIGDGYNNPSFGYGGYCLPKDTKQLLSEFEEIPQNIIKATVMSNETRIDFIANEINKMNPKLVGFYRLVVKEGSDNIRTSAVVEILKRLKNLKTKIIIYEPSINMKEIYDCKITKDLEYFKKKSNIIIANRMHPEISDVSSRVFSRDIYGIN